MRLLQRLAGALATAVAVAVPCAASAQALSDQFTYGLTIYGWLPDIHGHTTFPAGDSPGGRVDAGDIFDIKFVGMGAFAVQKDRWGAFTDIIYLNSGASKTNTRDLTIGGITLPASTTSNVSLDLKSTVWTLAASYRVLADPSGSLDVFVGGRMLDLKENLDYQFSADIGGLNPPPRSGHSEAKANNIDAIVGVRGRYGFGADRAWYVPYYVDVGTGDSDLTWQAVAGLGYTFQWGEVFAAWRYLDYKLKGENIQGASLSGPAIGVGFHW